MQPIDFYFNASLQRKFVAAIPRLRKQLAAIRSEQSYLFCQDLVREFAASEQGDVTVIEAGSTFRKTASNDMADVVMATPAVSGDRLLIRTIRNLYCLRTNPNAGAVD